MRIVIVLFFVLTSFTLFAKSDSLKLYVFLLEKCQICSASMPAIQEIYNEFGGGELEMYGVFSNVKISNEAGIDSFKMVHKVEFEVIFDKDQEYLKKFNATITPEVILVDTNSDEIIYRGKIDNLYERVGKRRGVVTEHYLQKAIKIHLEGDPVEISETEPVGCFIMRI